VKSPAPTTTITSSNLLLAQPWDPVRVTYLGM
jgi:hypothetical protein